MAPEEHGGDAREVELARLREARARAPDDSRRAAAGAALLAALVRQQQWAEAQTLAETVLRADPTDADALKAWKRARKAQGGELTIDRPEDERRRIYAGARGADEDALHHPTPGEHDAAGGAEGERAPPPPVAAAAEGAGARWARVQQGLAGWELVLVLKEGDARDWPIDSLRRRLQQQPAAALPRDALECGWCGQRLRAVVWPARGDAVPFRLQSPAETRVGPGAYRLPLNCPSCRRSTFVVWEREPR
ncbi:MAG: hypothetical protein HY906_06475 [Deltaproteobacteria bacterium]|nr:hypothetical protein [Deltaproteobacteria bacterium]